MNDNELKLLKYLVNHCKQGQVKVNEPRTYLAYSKVLKDLGFPNDRRTPGDSLDYYAMGGLAKWLYSNDFPAITGLIINKVGSGDRGGMPSATYFTFHERNDMDFAWHAKQVQLCCDFDWYSKLNEKGFFLKDTTVYPDEVDKDSGTLLEGATKKVIVNAYERNLETRNDCIKEHGVSCLVCDFNFADFYGPEASGFIHVHHVKPLSEIGEEYKVDPINDLIPVCPNCHAMLHRKNAPTVEQLREDIKFKQACK
ncbi:HNH endonuclease [Vibrio alginolyticus]|nr:HNH endonuclease [Vibrio alginolyticus]EKZ9012733.1 HNH endonuclease [Vibrio alginolyticus]ELB2756334.1 HNH endonuclease [Vibrio alginolyticus]